MSYLSQLERVCPVKDSFKSGLGFPPSDSDQPYGAVASRINAGVSQKGIELNFGCIISCLGVPGTGTKGGFSTCTCNWGLVLGITLKLKRDPVCKAHCTSESQRGVRAMIATLTALTQASRGL